MRIGHGYDVHKFCKDRPLIIGGVTVPYEYGLLGHSDADVLLHAVCDALLGAAGKGDIGKHFPDTNDKYKGIDSKLLLKEVKNIISESGYYVVNIDVTVIAQVPKLSPYIEKMVFETAKVLDIETSAVNIKATTEEGLGFTGEKLGIAAHCVCLIDQE